MPGLGALISIKKLNDEKLKKHYKKFKLVKIKQKHIAKQPKLVKVKTIQKI